MYLVMTERSELTDKSLASETQGLVIKKTLRERSHLRFRTCPVHDSHDALQTSFLIAIRKETEPVAGESITLSRLQIAILFT